LAELERLSGRKLSSRSPRQRTAGTTDWYEVVVHWRGETVGLVEAGYARMDDAVARAAELYDAPNTLAVYVVERATNDKVWSNGDYVGDFVEDDFRELVASINVDAMLKGAPFAGYSDFADCVAKN